MQTRLEAEICRSVLATWQIRRCASLSGSPEAPILGFDRLFARLALLRLLDRSPQATLEDARDLYRRNRVHNQIRYFRRRQLRAERWHRRLRLGAQISTALAFIAAAASLVLTVLHGSIHAGMAAELAALLLPLVSAALGSIMLTQEYSRRAVRYGEMVAALQVLQRQLRAVRTWDGLARVAERVEQELLQEVLEWSSFTRFVGGAH